MEDATFDEMMRLLLEQSAKECGVEFDPNSYVPEAEPIAPIAPMSSNSARPHRGPIDYSQYSNYAANYDPGFQNQYREPEVGDDGWENYGHLWDEEMERVRKIEEQQNMPMILENRRIREEQDREMEAMLAETKRQEQEKEELLHKEKEEQARKEREAKELESVSTLLCDVSHDTYDIRIRLNNKNINYKFSGHETIQRICNYIRHQLNIEQPILLFTSYPKKQLKMRRKLRECNLSSGREVLTVEIQE